MADVLPPIPYDRPQTSFEWIDWYTKLINLVNSGTQHNALPGLQGGSAGEYYHLTSVQFSGLTTGGETTLHKHLVADVVGAQKQMGFELHTDGTPAVSLTYNATNRTFTLTAKSGATFNIFVNGVKFTLSSPYTSTAHAATQGNHFLYHNGTSVVWDTNPWDLMLHAPMALAYYNATTADGVGYVETHTVSRDPALHRRLHEIEGTVLVSGGVLANWTANTDTDAAVTYSITSATIADEDIHTILSALADAGPYTVWYRSGAAGDWRWSTGNTVPFTFGTYPQYNEYTGATWQLTDTINNDFCVFYVLATPSVTSAQGFIIVPSQEEYTTLALAEAASFADLDLGTVPFQEFCVVAKVVMEAKSSYTNASNSVIKSVTRLSSSRSLAQAALITNHNTLNGIQGGVAGEYYHLDATDYNAVAGTRITKGTDTTDDIIIDLATKGLVLKDTQGTPHYWRVTIDNTGALVTSDLGTSKP